MSLTDLFQDLYRHMEWADAEVWSLVLASRAAAEDQVLLERLRHIHLVQRAFLDVWAGSPVDIHAGEALAAADLAGWAKDLHAEAQAHVRELRSGELDNIVEMPWAEQISQRLGTQPAATTLRDTVMQVYGHTGHHRAQVSTRLRELGETPPLIDYIAWIWLSRPPAAWP